MDNLLWAYLANLLLHFGVWVLRGKNTGCCYTSCSVLQKSQVPWVRHSNSTKKYSLANPSISVTLTSMQNIWLSHRGDVDSTSFDVRGDFGRPRLPCVTSWFSTQRCADRANHFPFSCLSHFYGLSVPTLWYRKSRVRFSRHPSSLLQIHLFGPLLLMLASVVVGPRPHLGSIFQRLQSFWHPSPPIGLNTQPSGGYKISSTNWHS